MKFVFIVLYNYLCVHSFIYGDFNTRLTAPFEGGLQNWSILLQKFDRQILDSAEPTDDLAAVASRRAALGAIPRWLRRRGESRRGAGLGAAGGGRGI